jgi:acetyl esterase/lipase
MPLYDQLRTLWNLNTNAARASIQTVAERLSNGPRRPTWSWAFEQSVRTMALTAPQEALQSAEPLRAPVDVITRFAAPIGIKRSEVSASGIDAEWIAPPEPSPTGAILYLHGGGYVFGSRQTHLLLIASVARHCNLRVLAPDYRLAPEHPYPAAVEDAWSVYWWMLQQGIDPTHLVIMGDSAGGGLVTALLIALREARAPLPVAAVLLSPWLDLTISGESIVSNADSDYLTKAALQSAAQMYANRYDVRSPLISPLFADLHGLPPFLVQVGSAEMLRDDGRRFAQRIKETGGAVTLEEWEDMVHVFHFWYPIETRSRQAVEHIAQFVKRHLAMTK